MKAIIGATVLVCGALIVFLLVQMAGVDENGNVGVKPAEATCSGKALECLPKVDMVDVQGQVFTADLLAEQVVVVNFWATWCKPCQSEIPALSRIYASYKSRGVHMLGVMTDDVAQETLESFQKRTGMNFPVIRVDDDVNAAFEYPDALPTTFVYGRDGRLALSKRGAISEAELKSVLDRLLAAAEPAAAPAAAPATH